MKTSTLWLCLSLALLQPTAHAASIFEKLGLSKGSTNTSALTAALSQEDVATGLKEALSKGVERAVTTLSKEDGFLKDVSVKIPVPDSLKKVEKTLRNLGQEKLADEFVTTMNRAAEQAAPEAAAVLGSAVKQMTLGDAKTILTSTNNAATAYFKRTSETNLFERFLPIVKKATEAAGVTSAYKKMTEKANFGGFSASSIFGQSAPDLDGYVTHKALDGLFLKIGEEEQRIRQNPAARTTAILQKVFGAINPAAPAKSQP